MKKYEVCVGFTVSAYIETTVEADSIEQLHAKLGELLAAGGGDEAAEVCWDSADDYRVVSVYSDDHKQLEVPAELQGLRQKVLVTMEGGVIQNVEHEPGIEVEVHDYDIEFYDMEGLNENVRTDDSGDRYAMRTF